MKLYEKRLQRIFYVLYDLNGNPVTGLLPSDIIFRYAKATDSGYSIKTLIAGETGNFGELGYGSYWTDITAEEADTIGSFLITISTLTEGPSAPSPIPEEIDPKHIVCNIEPYPVVPGPDLKTCLVFGNIRDLSGHPIDKPVEVIAHVLILPTEIEGSYISTKVINVYTDVDGLFKIKLAVGAKVRVEVPSTGLRRQFVVPDTETANIKYLPSE